MENYPEPDLKDPVLGKLMLSLLEQKSKEEGIAESILLNSNNIGEQKLAKALKLSCRIVAEDCAREANFMLPQSQPVRELLVQLENRGDLDIKEIIQKLI